MLERKNIFPEGLAKRIVGGHVLYSPVVTVVPGRLIFVSGLLARNGAGEIVGKGNMREQIRQVGENLKTALAAAGATLQQVPMKPDHLCRVGKGARAESFRV